MPSAACGGLSPKDEQAARAPTPRVRAGGRPGARQRAARIVRAGGDGATRAGVRSAGDAQRVRLRVQHKEVQRQLVGRAEQQVRVLQRLCAPRAPLLV